MTDPQQNISALLSEDRVFEPSAEFRARAVVRDRSPYEAADADHEAFWAEQAERLSWYRRWDRVMDWTPPWVTWFSGGTLNARSTAWIATSRPEAETRSRITGRASPARERSITYKELLDEVCRFANVLRSLGVRRGDRVAIYLGMIPELPVAMLACARIGAPHSVVFGGFSADSLRDRINDAEAKVLVTADGGYRRGQVVPLKANADEAVARVPVDRARRDGAPDRRRASVHARPRRLVPRADRRAVARVRSPSRWTSEDLLYLLYTSGTTGKPKGIVHTTGGYLTQVAATHRMIFDIHEDDVFWCSADIGWVTGHSYIVYGPLANHTTGIIYEGAPDWPDKDRLWQVVEKYRATILYTAPTAIRAFMRWGTEFPRRHDLSSLRLLGTVGEPINPEAWVWYWTYIGGERCPIVDTWWQTETGSILITPAARDHVPEARVGHVSVPRHPRRRLRRARALGAARRRAGTWC